MSHKNPVLMGILTRETAVDNPVIAHLKQLAKVMKSDIHLFLSIYDSGYEKQLSDRNESEKKEEAHAVVSARAQLEQSADLLRAEGFRTTATLNWNSPNENAVATAIAKIEPDLMVCQRPQSRWLAMLPIFDPIWNLSKLTNAAVIFVNNAPRIEKSNAIWAAVDLADKNSNAQLNHQIIKQAKKLAAYFDTPLHLVHCYSSGAELAEIAIGLSSTDYLSAQEIQETKRMRHFEKMRELADAHNIPHKNIHNLPGVAQVVLPLLAARQRPGYIVAGTHNRGRVAKYFHGSTTKKLLQRTTGALCVVHVPNEPQDGTDSVVHQGATDVSSLYENMP